MRLQPHGGHFTCGLAAREIWAVRLYLRLIEGFHVILRSFLSKKLPAAHLLYLLCMKIFKSG